MMRHAHFLFPLFFNVESFVRRVYFRNRGKLKKKKIGGSAIAITKDAIKLCLKNSEKEGEKRPCDRRIGESVEAKHTSSRGGETSKAKREKYTGLLLVIIGDDDDDSELLDAVYTRELCCQSLPAKKTARGRRAWSL